MDGARASSSGRLSGLVALTALLLAAAAGAALTAGAWKQGFRVARMRTEGNRIVPDSTLIRLAGIPAGGVLYAVDLAAARARVLASPFLEGAALRRDPPDAIVIAVVERQPVAALATDRILEVDAGGVVLPPLPPARAFDLPVITGDVPGQECIPGRRLRAPAVLGAVEILATARTIGEEFAHLISEVHCRADSTYTLYTTEAGVPVAFGRGDVPVKLLELEGFWTQCVMQRGAAHLRSVDLRFADQVVVRWDGGNSPPAE